jgi:hypothetical protein
MIANATVATIMYAMPTGMFSAGLIQAGGLGPGRTTARLLFSAPAGPDVMA